MKKIFTILAIITLAAVACKADGIKQQITIDQLPAAGAKFLKNYFASQTPSYIIKETKIGRAEYEIYYPTGVEVELDQNGDWKKVDGHGNVIPGGFYPAGIDSAINTSFPGVKIQQIEKKYWGYEVELINGMDLKFNQSLQMTIDD